MRPVAAVFGLLLLTSFSCATQKQEGPTTESGSAASNAEFVNYEQAVKTARAENKLIMVDVYTDWCTWCKKLDKDVYPDPKVRAELAKYFTATKLNAEADTKHEFQGESLTEQQIASKLQVSGYPTIIFLDPKEAVVQQIGGYVPAENFAKALRFIGTGAYKTEDFDTWAKKQTD